MTTNTLANPEQVIISLPFTGNCQTFIKKDGIVAYSNGLTFEAYQASHPELDLKVLSWDEYNTLHAEFYKRPFTEITEDQYENALGELPPHKWHNIGDSGINVFFCSEAMSGEFHSCYIYDRASGKYWAGMIDVFSSDAQILEEYQKAL